MQNMLLLMKSSRQKLIKNRKLVIMSKVSYTQKHDINRHFIISCSILEEFAHDQA